MSVYHFVTPKSNNPRVPAPCQHDGKLHFQIFLLDHDSKVQVNTEELRRVRIADNDASNNAGNDACSDHDYCANVVQVAGRGELPKYVGVEHDYARVGEKRRFGRVANENRKDDEVAGKKRRVELITEKLSDIQVPVKSKVHQIKDKCREDQVSSKKRQFSEVAERTKITEICQKRRRIALLRKDISRVKRKRDDDENQIADSKKRSKVASDGNQVSTTKRQVNQATKTSPFNFVSSNNLDRVAGVGTSTELVPEPVIWRKKRTNSYKKLSAQERRRKIQQHNLEMLIRNPRVDVVTYQEVLARRDRLVTSPKPPSLDPSPSCVYIRRPRDPLKRDGQGRDDVKVKIKGHKDTSRRTNAKDVQETQSQADDTPPSSTTVEHPQVYFVQPVLQTQSTVTTYAGPQDVDQSPIGETLVTRRSIGLPREMPPASAGNALDRGRLVNLATSGIVAGSTSGHSVRQDVNSAAVDLAPKPTAHQRRRYVSILRGAPCTASPGTLRTPLHPGTPVDITPNTTTTTTILTTSNIPTTIPTSTSQPNYPLDVPTPPSMMLNPSSPPLTSGCKEVYSYLDESSYSLPTTDLIPPSPVISPMAYPGKSMPRSPPISSPSTADIVPSSASPCIDIGTGDLSPVSPAPFPRQAEQLDCHEHLLSRATMVCDLASGEYLDLETPEPTVSTSTGNFDLRATSGSCETAEISSEARYHSSSSTARIGDVSSNNVTPEVAGNGDPSTSTPRHVTTSISNELLDIPAEQLLPLQNWTEEQRSELYDCTYSPDCFDDLSELFPGVQHSDFDPLGDLLDVIGHQNM